MKQEKRKQSYQPPQLTVVTFATERGFAASKTFQSAEQGSFNRHNFSVGDERSDQGSLW
ncbi:MAG: hypothetical protein SPL12_03670 [Bacteroidales bacterium]|nr:hypothetical protein [Bacteroidales bacterium]